MQEEKMYAKEKLEETLYFLLQMRHNYIDRKQFIYTMNAFLNSARSVTFTLQKEFADNPRFKAWYPQKKKEMKEDKLMSFFKNLRDVSVHEKGSPQHSLSVKTAYIFPKGKMFQADTVGYSERKYSDEDKAEMGVFRVMFEGKMLEPVYTLITDWQFEKAPEGYEGKDILALCTEYYHKLRKLIEEAQTDLFKKK
jgi:hypothetical protein